METNRLNFPVLLIALAAVGCGGNSGSGSNAPSPPPLVPPKEFKLELLSGITAVDLSRCQSVNGAAASARFSRLLRATVYKDAVYLTETGEGCTNVVYDARGVVPVEVQPAIRKLADGTVKTTIQLNSYITMMSHPVMVRYPSGFIRNESGKGGLVLGYAAASSDQGFALDATQVARYFEQGGWDYYVPGLFKLSDSIAGYNDLVVGAPGKPPAVVDGQGKMAGFVAPHDLEANAAGVLYVIDDGRIRTIDASQQVKTLDHAALGITGTVKGLDSDPQGNIHVLSKRDGASYSWHRLSDGFRLDFQTRQAVISEPVTVETFTVLGDAILMAVRLPSGDTSLFRISATGEVKEVTGNKPVGSAQDFLDHPSEYMLPAVQHIEYGVDGHLYIVLPQGVLIARNYM